MQVGQVKRRCGIAANWRLSARNVVNLVRSQVHHIERALYLFAARLAGLLATADPCTHRLRMV